MINNKVDANIDPIPQRKSRRGSNFPFNPAKVPFFYGWAIIFLGAFGIIMSIPGQTMGVSVFTDSLINALNITRNDISTSYLIGTIASAFCLPLAGLFSNRFGNRMTAVLSGILMGLTLLVLSNIDTIAMKVSSSFPQEFQSLINMILIAFGFFFLRFSGQGVMTMVSRNMVVKWFDKYRSIAAALLGAFTTFGFSIAPQFLAYLKSMDSWQGAWRLLALTSLFVFTPIAFIFFRNTPEECGLIQDGTKNNKEPSKIVKFFSGTKHPAQKSMTRKQAFLTDEFWIYNIGIAFWALFNTAFTFHLFSIYKEAGISENIAVKIFFPIAIISVTVRFTGSAFSDRIKLSRMLIMMLGGLLLASFALLNPGNLYLNFLIIIGLGIAQGFFGVLNTLTWVQFYGPKYLNSITGITMGTLVAGSALGPYLFSYFFTKTKSYQSAAIVCSIIIIFLLIQSLIIILFKPRIIERTVNILYRINKKIITIFR